MNLVLVNHDNDERPFLFEVSDDIKPHINKGKRVACETMYGLKSGVCSTNVFEIDGEDIVAFIRLTKAYLPIKKVVALEIKADRNTKIQHAKEILEELTDKRLPF